MTTAPELPKSLFVKEGFQGVAEAELRPPVPQRRTAPLLEFRISNLEFVGLAVWGSLWVRPLEDVSYFRMQTAAYLLDGFVP